MNTTYGNWKADLHPSNTSTQSCPMNRRGELQHPVRYAFHRGLANLYPISTPILSDNRTLSKAANNKDTEDRVIQ